jgi:hypothetical protein
MQAHDLDSSPAELDLTLLDLGPLAWVLDELKTSLESASKALRRFVREAETVSNSDLAALDASQLHTARKQLHQSLGALEMVGMNAPALMLRAMESAVQKFIQSPALCTADAASKIELAGFSLTHYLEDVLAGKPVSAVSLFPQYRDIQGLAGAERIHPADLWAFEWRWIEPAVTRAVDARPYGDDARQLLDRLMLNLIRTGAPETARSLSDVCLGFAAAQADVEPRAFWKIAAGFFEALAQGLLKVDLYVKRATLRILLQYVWLVRGTEASARLAQDLLFMCSQAKVLRAADAPVLSAVRNAYGLTRVKPVDYESVQFGRFAPALIAQARKRIAAARESWSSATSGDVGKFKSLKDQFSLVSDSLVKLHPPSEPMARALSRVIDATVAAAKAPAPELAMEVAAAVLYLEAVFDDFDPNDPTLWTRTARLAERLESARAGGQPQPLESWMEQLYQSVNDKQTMVNVVDELRLSLADLERSLDNFFRAPDDKKILAVVPGQLARMQGVLSMLELDQAALAVMHMRELVEKMIGQDIDEQQARVAGMFDRLGNNLGALSFLIDMLNYQPRLARRLFVYDAAKGELKADRDSEATRK